MRTGVDRQGNHLYPAFPYDHFTLVTDEDDRALYAYLMTRAPVKAERPANDLPFPLNLRPILAGWKLLFLNQGPYRPDPSKDATWNRGAYLAEGLGHCGACHTPRNALGAEIKDRQYAGGDAEGWTAYPINADSPAPVPWTAERLADFLQHGFLPSHGMARGSMAPIVGDLGSVPEEDVRAIAIYVASVIGPPAPEEQASGEQLLKQVEVPRIGDKPASAGSQTAPIAVSGDEAGEALYAAMCSSCHESGRDVPYGGLDLALSTAVSGPDPQNMINVILYGIPAAEGERSGVMPGFNATLSNDQLTVLVTYIREQFSTKPPWNDVAGLVGEIRSGTVRVTQRSADGVGIAPANVSRRETTW